MHKKMLFILWKLLEKSENVIALKAIDKILKNGIPFNKSLHIKTLYLKQNDCSLYLPYRRSNLNHLRTMHACAQATIGEMTAGMLLLKNFNPSIFRILMTQLKVDYSKHAITDLRSHSIINKSELLKIEKDLHNKGEAFISLKTEVKNSQNEVVSITSTKWQIKKYL